jgi:hypothetical protein
MEIKEQIQKELEGIKTGLESTISEKVKTDVQKATSELKAALESGNKEEVTKAVKENLGTINESLKEFAQWKGEKSDADKANQEALDKLIVQIKEINVNTKPKGTKSFIEAFQEQVMLPENQEGIKSVRKGHPFKMQVKTVGDMTTAGNLTGDQVATYSPKQAILPAQKVNFRDLIPSVHSDTGLYVHYKESGGEGAAGIQTEGNDKDQIDYDFTEVKTVQKYVQGFARFSKQMMRNLPWLQGTLPRLLLRDFYKKENAYFYAAAATAATGSTTTAATDDVEALIDYISTQFSADFNASFVLVNWKQMGRLNKLLYKNGWNNAAGGVISRGDGTLNLSGVPVIAASFATDDKALVIDNDFIERVETESIAVEFFEQDYKNVTQNKITARIECLEELNPMLGSSLIYADFGNNS